MPTRGNFLGPLPMLVSAHARSAAELSWSCRPGERARGHRHHRNPFRRRARYRRCDTSAGLVAINPQLHYDPGLHRSLTALAGIQHPGYCRLLRQPFLSGRLSPYLTCLPTSTGASRSAGGYFDKYGVMYSDSPTATPSICIAMAETAAHIYGAGRLRRRTDGIRIYTSAGGLTVTAPEPSTWAMMLLGFAGLGFAGYRTSRKAGPVGA